jgi:hypothetical protein
VLHRAALAALERPVGAPRPGQFVYTKIADGDGSVYQSWLSVDGTRSGLLRSELGVTTRGAGGATGAGALLKLAIVNKPGQLP